ncbi:hypothetical protein WJX74_001559 [Apatococcus lobatus]|uniref:snRNA-activating protein complex subunit 3 n=1 Tax=Apatococcus lobatus TaxID=904363 RepID=A0AAW1SAV2_9CHLO
MTNRSRKAQKPTGSSSPMGQPTNSRPPEANMQAAGSSRSRRYSISSHQKPISGNQAERAEAKERFTGTLTRIWQKSLPNQNSSQARKILIMKTPHPIWQQPGNQQLLIGQKGVHKEGQLLMELDLPGNRQRKRPPKCQPRLCCKCKQVRKPDLFAFRAKVCNLCRLSSIPSKGALPSKAGQEGALMHGASADLIQDRAAGDLQQAEQLQRKRCCPALEGPIGCGVPNFLSSGIRVADFKQRGTELWQQLLNQLDASAEAADDCDLSVTELEWETFELFKEKADARDGLVRSAQPTAPGRSDLVQSSAAGIRDCSGDCQPGGKAAGPGDTDDGPEMSRKRVRKLDEEWRACVSQKMENAKPHLASVRRGLARIASDKADKHGSFRLSSWKQSSLQPDDPHPDADIPCTHLLHSNRVPLPDAELDQVSEEAEAPRHDGPLPGWESCSGPSVPHDETLLRIEIRHHDRPIKVAQSLLVLGSNTLAELRDKICCPAESSMQSVHHWSSPSSFFFIEGTFFNDQRNPEAQNHSAEIIDFCQRQNLAAPVKFLPLPLHLPIEAQQPRLGHEDAPQPSLQPGDDPAQSLPAPLSAAAIDEHQHGSVDQAAPTSLQADPLQIDPGNATPHLVPNSLTGQPLSKDSRPQHGKSNVLTGPKDRCQQAPPTALAERVSSSEQVALDFDPCLDDSLPDLPSAAGHPSHAPAGPQSQSLQDFILAADAINDKPQEIPGFDAAQLMQHSLTSVEPEAAPAAFRMTAAELTGALCGLDVEVGGAGLQGSAVPAHLGDRAGTLDDPLHVACWSEPQLQPARQPDLASQQRADLPGRTSLASGSMEETRFQDLDLRAGARASYIFCHQGGCEHLLVVRDIRRIHTAEMSDPSFIASYPYCAFQDERPKRMCDICIKNPGVCITHDDELAPKGSCIWCRECYEMMHFIGNPHDGKALAAPHRVFSL